MCGYRVNPSWSRWWAPAKGSTGSRKQEAQGKSLDAAKEAATFKVSSQMLIVTPLNLDIDKLRLVQ